MESISTKIGDHSISSCNSMENKTDEEKVTTEKEKETKNMEVFNPGKSRLKMKITTMRARRRMMMLI